LWTDSRYWNQATLQLPNGWTLQKQGQTEVPTIPKWLTSQDKLRVGLDPLVHPHSFLTSLQTEDKDHNVVDVVTDVGNLVDDVWEHRPALPSSPWRVHPLEYAGMSVDDKVATIRTQMLDKNATLCVLSALDEIAYLLNLRCQGDIETCPVGLAYATISPTDITLYCDPAKLVSDEVREHLKDFTVLPYDQIVPDIEGHTGTIWLDASKSNIALVQAAGETALHEQSPVVPLKACKNEAELTGMRRAHVVDGIAMAQFIAWLEHELTQRTVSEVEIDERLTGYRAQQEGFVEVSFPTIAGVGSNGAIVHYRASADSDLHQELDLTTPILIDSGGQYLYGTTDVTRTWYFGDTPDATFRESYTRVLQGHIGVDQMVFPVDTPGFVLDVMARRHLWQAGLDYGHGTGHGVGAALNVHEGPQSISPRFGNKEGLKAGMVVSNEPGYYEDGEYGIRIENLLEIQAVAANDKPGRKHFLKFARLTQIPIQKSLILTHLMSQAELDWLDAYHAEVWSKVSPHLEPGSPAFVWLEKSCAKIERK